MAISLTKIVLDLICCEYFAALPDFNFASFLEACQLCSSAMLGEELCFRHTTILGSCCDLTTLAAPLPRFSYSLSGLADGCAALFGPFGCPRRSLGKRTHRRIDKRALGPSVPGVLFF
jgi:hypothetical protein